MVRFSIDTIKSLMSQQDKIRNISVIAHVDHGKTTLSDSLIEKAGIIPESAAGSRLVLDTTKEEIERGITIKSTAISLYYSVDGEAHLINLIDSPGHVDFSSEVSAALRVTDGALVVVDCIEGMCVQTVTVLRQALAERVTPVLILNKIDRAFLELQLSAEEAYQRFAATISEINQILQEEEEGEGGEQQQRVLSPQHGNVCFASAVGGWGFTLSTFARKYATKFGIDPIKLTEKLWGENYYDSETKKWTTSNVSESGKVLKRGFVQFILEPIMTTLDLAMKSEKSEEEREKVFSRMEKEKVRLSEEDRSLKGKGLMKVCMRRWILVGDAVLEMVVRHLPSPVEAQRRRVEVVYAGERDDETAKSISRCDANGELVVFVSKMVCLPGSVSRFLGFGRVFSGTVRPGMSVRVLTPDYDHISQQGVHTNVRIKATILMMGAGMESIDSCGAGNVVGLVGIDEYILKSGTITTSATAMPIKTLTFKVSPVVRVSVKPKNASDLPKLIEGLKRLNKSDPMVEVVFEHETGEMVVCGAGELHLEVVLKDLETYAQVPIVAQQPSVSYRETVIGRSSAVCLAKSSNKLNRVTLHAEPLGEEMVVDLEKSSEALESKKLVEVYGWDSTQAKKIWACGPAPAYSKQQKSVKGKEKSSKGTNILVDGTKGIQNIGDMKDSAIAALEMMGNEGVLCGEGMRGVKLVVDDGVLHADAAHRGSGQLIAPLRRSMSAAILCAQPRLLEPIFDCQISSPSLQALGAIYTVLHSRRAAIYEQQQTKTSMHIVKAYLPVAESFGFAAQLRAATSGQAFPQCLFSHWQILDSDPLLLGSPANQIVTAVRQRKHLPPLPSLESLIDRL